MNPFNYSRGSYRHYGVVVAVAAIALVFHSSVNRRFFRMISNLADATVLKHKVLSEELVLFDHHMRGVHLHSESRHHTAAAYEMVRKADNLSTTLEAERLEAQGLHDEAEELRGQARQDAAKAINWTEVELSDEIAALSTRMKGEYYAQLAESEELQADYHNDSAVLKEEEGKERLARAESLLDIAKGEDQNVTKVESGICSWVSFFCNLVRRNPELDRLKTTSRLGIAAASEMDAAMKEIRDAKEERDLAVELYRNSSLHNNVSISLLKEAHAFENKAKEDQAHSVLDEAQAENEADLAEKEEEKAIQEDKEILEGDEELWELQRKSAELLEQADEEREVAEALLKKADTDRKQVEKFHSKMFEVLDEAKHHAAHACWYGLFACIFGSLLLSLVTIRIVDTLQTKHPWKWIIRQEPYAINDISYNANHVLILLLSMAFSGEILQEYGRRDRVGRVEITLLFALAGAFLQGVLLHFLPNLYQIVASTGLDRVVLRRLLDEDILRRTLAMFCVFSCELVLCWICFGRPAFDSAYRLNGWLFWIFVGSTSIVHTMYLRHTGVDSVAHTEGHQSDTVALSAVDESENTTLFSRSTVSNVSTQPSLMSTVNLNSQEESSTEYGSLLGNQHLSVPSEVTSTFISSWEAEVEKIRFLFDVLVFAWAVWMLQNDARVTIVLSRFDPQLVWGGFPAPILSMCIIALLMCVVRKWISSTDDMSRQGYDSHSQRAVDNKAVTIEVTRV